MDMEAKNVPIKAKVICGGQTTILTLVLKHLRGRGSITVLSRERIMNAKLEGWPEDRMWNRLSGGMTYDIAMYCAMLCHAVLCYTIRR